MKWGKFKEAVEASGITDQDEIYAIDISEEIPVGFSIEQEDDGYTIKDNL